MEWTVISMLKRYLVEFLHGIFFVNVQWSLKPKEFAKRFPGYDDFGDYMQNYFNPTFEPHWEQLKKMQEDVTNSEDVESK